MVVNSTFFLFIAKRFEEIYLCADTVEHSDAEVVLCLESLFHGLAGTEDGDFHLFFANAKYLLNLFVAHSFEVTQLHA